LVPDLLKHQLLTDDEASVCQSLLALPTHRTQEFLHCLKRKGNGILPSLLCCLTNESTPGHKDVAAKLKEAMISQNLGNVCSICRPIVNPTLDEMFNLVEMNYPTEKWEELACALKINRCDIELIKIVDDNTISITMVLEEWKKMHPQATKDIFAARLHDANLDSILQ